MMFGLGIRKGFISVLAIGYLMVISCLASVQMMILENRMEFYSSLDLLDKRVYFEVLILERIKDSYEQELVSDCKIGYYDIFANIDYEGNVVIVEFSYDNIVFKRKYVYNAEFGFLEIIAL